jgi:hypothetical protein
MKKRKRPESVYLDTLLWIADDQPELEPQAA